MIVRRIALTTVLILFASVTIAVILGLDDAARSDLAVRVTGTAPASATPEGQTTKTAAQPRLSSPAPTPTTQPTSEATTPQPTPTQPTPKATTRPSTKPTAQPKPKVTAKVKPKPKPKPKPKATTKPSAEPKTSSKATSSKKAKKTHAYLTGPLKKGPGGVVYLTFDDGPSPYTASILGTLSRTGSTATFFHLGINEGGFPHADAAIRSQGSNVANHSYDHPDLRYLGKSQLKWQLKHGPKAKCFRPPYGATNSTVRSAIAHAGMREVLWSIDTLDWTRPGVSTLAKIGRLKAVRNGSIILMHDGGGDRSQTVAALPRVIADLHARGYKVRALPYC